MIYITIILVSSGLFLIIYSFFISSDKKSPGKRINKRKKSKLIKKKKISASGLKNSRKPAVTEPEEPRNHETVNDIEQKKIECESIETGSSENEKTDSEKQPEAAEDQKEITEIDAVNIETEKTETAPVTEKETTPEITAEEKPVEKEQTIEPENSDEALIDDTEIKEELVSSKTETEVTEDHIYNSFATILFEDTSSIFDYQNNSSIIDITLKEYEKIKRKGKGTLEIAGNGINFTTDNKNYRFDFHRIEKITMGEKYLAILVKKSNTVRLFILGDNAETAEYFIKSYNEYTRGRK